MFAKGSRYEPIDDAELTDEAGRVVRYKKVRFIGKATPQVRHLVNQGERLDHIAFRYYRAPELFWRVCDANAALWPDDLVAEPGEQIVVPPAQER